MTVPAATFKTFEAVGNREDLEDVIWDISPTETPFQTMVSKTKAKATYHEWQTDELAAAATNAQLQGDDATTLTASPTVRLRNYCQILSKTARVSGTQEAVDHAGRESEMSYQVMKRTKELKRDLEYALVRNQGSTSGAAGSAAQMGSIESWISVNKTSAGISPQSNTTPAFASGSVVGPTDATVAGTLTETHLKHVISLAWAAGGNPEVLMVGPLTKQKISTAFAGVATRNRDYSRNQQVAVISGVDLYVSDFGEHKIIPNRFMRDQNILALDMDYWEIAQLRPLKSWELAKTGDSFRRQLLMEATLVSRQEKASAKVTDINPAV